MLKLIKLEWKRNNISRLIRNAVIMTAVLLVFIMITAGEAGADVTTRGFFNKSFIHASVELFTHMSYMVFTGVMLAGLIVGEYAGVSVGVVDAVAVGVGDVDAVAVSVGVGKTD